MTSTDLITPPASIGILGGGQLGRMLGYAARSMGYGVRVLDPDPDCPAAAIADQVEVGGYNDLEAALRMATGCAVVTYELEHVDATLVEAIEAAGVPVRPGVVPLRVTQDRLAERRFLAAQDIAVAPWREVQSGDDDGLAGAVAILDLPIRLKAALGGYDGRSQIRIGSRRERTLAWMDLGRPPGQPVLAERELQFEAELSVVCARSLGGQVVSFPVARNVHDNGILVESVMPAAVSEAAAASARAIAARLAEAMDLVGLLTVELFLMSDGSLIVNELAPRVHNSGHLTVEGNATSQFEQHIRAICGLPLGATEVLSPAAMVNLLGTGARRPAVLTGMGEALADPDVHVHVYGKRQVHDRRKMGHVTVLGSTTDDALDRARTAAGLLRWMP